MNETTGLLTFTLHQSGRSRSQAIAKAQKAAETRKTTTKLTRSPSDTRKIIPTIINQPGQLEIMAPTSCANCDTATTNSHPLKLYSACKTVAYCNRDCQKANWKAHKPSCRHSTSRKAKEQASSKEIEAMLEESLLPDGQLQFSETISIPHDSYLLKNMRPVSELPLGWQKMMACPPQFLASISHLSAQEQEKAKTDWVNQMEAMIEASMTPEAHEAQRLELIEVGKIQQRFLAKMAAKKAAKDAGSR